MSITYRDGADGITADHLRGGFFVGWPSPPSPETHLRLLRGSDAVGLAIDEASVRVVGYITALSDDVLFAYISSLEVLPAYHGRGIGTELTRRMLERLRRLYAVDLVCDPDVQPFYARLGMRPATAMLLRNHERQSGR